MRQDLQRVVPDSLGIFLELSMAKNNVLFRFNWVGKGLRAGFGRGLGMVIWRRLTRKLGGLVQRGLTRQLGSMILRRLARQLGSIVQRRLTIQLAGIILRRLTTQLGGMTQRLLTTGRELGRVICTVNVLSWQTEQQIFGNE